MGKTLRLVQVIEIQKDFLALREELKGRGHFDYPAAQLIWDFSRFACLLVVSVALYRLNQAFLALIVLTLTTIDARRWIQDAARGAIFQSETKSFWTSEAMSIFFLGVPFSGYDQYIRHRHHGTTDVFESEAPVAYGPRKNQLALFAILLGRWSLFSSLFYDHLFLIFVPLIATGLLIGCTASLDLFHLPVSRWSSSSFAGRVLERTQNISEKNRLLTWLFSGLNYHIEHHLFPDMPSRNYPKISRDIRVFANYHGLPYREARLADAGELLLRRYNAM
jgi:hypothetical protein